MLTRPEAGTVTHILFWLSQQPADKSYAWGDPRQCACGQYSAEFLGNDLRWAAFTNYNAPIGWLNKIAREHVTFGSLYEAALEELS